MDMKLRKKRAFFLLVLLLVLGYGIWLVAFHKNEVKMESLLSSTKEEVESYCKQHHLAVKYEYQYDSSIEKGRVISQSISENQVIKAHDQLVVTISKGSIPIEEYQKNNIDELGKVPIMMYHGIIEGKDQDTKYTGGNVDKDGYNRTTESFRRDLNFYYENGYRMIRLQDYIDGNIDVEFGKSPIVLTFDDGREDNFKVLGKENGKLKIDPNCAVGILEEFKAKYPDFNVTATFFVNKELFQQKEYNEEILKWLVENGYDVGNHTMTHPDFTKISLEESHEEVGGVYEILEKIIPGRYVPIIALPYGSPYKLTHENYEAIQNSNYNGRQYETKGALRVGWEAEVSPYDIDFNPLFIKRIRAYDHEGEEFDITMSFRLLEKNRYISDGDPQTIVTTSKKKDDIKETDKKVITYEA